MIKVETPKHLYSRPLYRSVSNQWHSNYSDVIKPLDVLHIDEVSITSMLSFGQTSRDRTLFNEISRLPWHAKPLDNGKYVLEALPKHGFIKDDIGFLAKKLYERLENEARRLINSYSNIYILLTGGLDSRIIAAIFESLYNKGELKHKPKCLTWGTHDSRDVVYAKETADILGFEWQNIPLTPQTVMDNIRQCGKYLGLLHSPEMMHSMLWFKDIESDAIVVAGSFGDSIGRAEFSNLHLLQLDYKTPQNTFNLLSSDAFNDAKIILQKDLDYIHNRNGQNNLKHISCEYWMQGYRMRNGLCHALSLINNFASVYQMFTAHEVYSFVWSIHPSYRGDDMYYHLINKFFPKLSKIPWARTNKTLLGKNGKNDLKQHYHDYTGWSGKLLYDEISSLVNPEWFASTGLFDRDSIREINRLVKESNVRVGRLNDIWLWLAGFKYYIDFLESEGKTIVFKDRSIKKSIATKPRNINNGKNITLIASKSRTINRILRQIRKKVRDIDLIYRKRIMRKRFPPVKYKSVNST